MRIRWPILFQLLILATLMIGGLAASVLLIRSQDVRQQASTGFGHGPPMCINSNECVGPDKKLWCQVPGTVAQQVEGKCGVPAKVASASANPTGVCTGRQQENCRSTSGCVWQGSACISGTLCEQGKPILANSIAGANTCYLEGQPSQRWQCPAELSTDRTRCIVCSANTLGQCMSGKVCLPGSRSFSVGPTLSAVSCNTTVAGRYCDYDAECQSGRCSVNGESGGGTCLSQGATESALLAVGPAEETVCSTIRSSYDCEEDPRCVWHRNSCIAGDRCRSDAPVFSSPIINSIRCYDPGYTQAVSQCAAGYRPSLDGRRCEYELSAPSQCQYRGIFYEQGRSICDPERANISLTCQNGTFREFTCIGGNVCQNGTCVAPTQSCNAETLGQCIGGNVCTRNPLNQSYQLGGLGCYLGSQGSTCQYDAECQSRVCENNNGRRICASGTTVVESQLPFCSQPAYRCQNFFLEGAELCRDSLSNQKFCCPTGTEKIESGCVSPENVPRAPSRPLGEQVGNSIVGAVENVGTAVVNDIEFRGQALHGLLTLPSFEERVAAGALALLPGLGTTQQACQDGLTLECAGSIGVTSVVGAVELTGAASVVRIPGYSQVRGSVIQSFSPEGAGTALVTRTVSVVDGYSSAFVAQGVGMSPADFLLARDVVNNTAMVALNRLEVVSTNVVTAVAGTGTSAVTVGRAVQSIGGVSRVANQLDEATRILAPAPPAYEFGKSVVGIESVPVVDQVVGCIDRVTMDAAETLFGSVVGAPNPCPLY